MKTLQTIQNELRDLVPQGNDLVLAALKKTLQPGTDKYNDYLALEGRYQDISRQLLQGVVSNEDATLEFNKIRQAIIEFIDSLQSNDIPQLSSTSNPGNGMADVYNGEVLYRIPKKMQLGVEEECVVRLAFDRQRLIEQFEVQVGDVMKDLRISDVMGVELLDPNSDKAFYITTIHDTVQFVEKDLVTEWIFCVTPLKEGQYPLVLKISIIEIINGIERKRNEVLKEQVEILTQKLPEDEPGFVSAGYTWQVTGAAEQRAVAKDSGGTAEVEIASPKSQPSIPQPTQVVSPNAPSPQTSNRGFRKIGTLLGALVALVVAVIAMKGLLFNEHLAPNGDKVVEVGGDDPEWQGVKKRRQKKELEDFADKYPGTPEATIALNMLDTLEEEAWQDAVAINDYAAMEQYIRIYPTGKYAQTAALRMDEINHAKDLVKLDSQQVEIVTPVPKPIDTGTGRNHGDRPRNNAQKPKPKPQKNQPPQKKPSTNTGQGTKPAPEKTKPNLDKTVEAKPKKPDPNQPVLLVSAARKPIFRRCGNKNQEKEEKCTAERIHEFLSDNVLYPEIAIKKGIKGTVVVSFVVERDGSISNVKALNKLGGGCEEEAVRVVKTLPKFTAGKNVKGEAVRVQYTQPITFRPEK